MENRIKASPAEYFNRDVTQNMHWPALGNKAARFLHFHSDSKVEPDSVGTPADLVVQLSA
jgi:hypothetical protein